MNLTGPALLDAIRYLPCLRSRQAELRGYQELRPATKGLIHPLISIGRYGRTGEIARVIDVILERVGPCFIDLNSSAGQRCSDFDAACDPTDNYAAWRNLAAGKEGVTPVALLTEGATERAFVRQALLIERGHGGVVIRSRRPAQDLPSLSAVLSAVDDVNNVLIVLDLGFIRGAMEPKTMEARRAITALRLIDPATRIAVTGTSFPRSVSVYGDRRGSLEIAERDLHVLLGGNEVAIYGDHSAVYSEPFEPSMARWVPRIDYCLDDAWKWERRRDDEGGFVECAKQIVALPDWDATFASEVWGAGKIKETAESGQIPAGFGSPANWIAARVNMHIERQTAAFSRSADSYDLDDLLE